MAELRDRDLHLAGFETVEAFGLTHRIMIPPTVDIRAHRSPVVETHDPTPMVCYPLPPGWQRTAPIIDLTALDRGGWLAVETTEGLLNNFINLAELASEAPDAQAIQAVRRFVCHWGPLWLCRNRRHGRDCFWTVATAICWPGNPCQWVPREEVVLFLQYARQAKAAFLAGHEVRQGKPAPRELLRTLGARDEQLGYDVPQQREFLRRMLNRYVMGPLGFQVGTVWTDRRGPRLMLHSGLGFFRAVWLEITQLVCGARLVSQCDSCGQLYLRKGRRPQEGRRNYCASCGTGEGYRMAKQVSARERRARNRAAAIRPPDPGDASPTMPSEEP
jgi:hypothetical protein